LENKGDSKVYLKVAYNGDNRYIESGFRVNNSKELVEEIKSYFNNFIEVA
jgi:hypothetical protein